MHEAQASTYELKHVCMEPRHICMNGPGSCIYCAPDTRSLCRCHPGLPQPSNSRAKIGIHKAHYSKIHTSVSQFTPCLTLLQFLHKQFLHKPFLHKQPGQFPSLTKCKVMQFPSAFEGLSGLSQHFITEENVN